MSKPQGLKPVDKHAYNFASQDFIPIACHFDKATLLTKNGELIQTLQISGAYSQDIGEELLHLREMIRDAISKNIKKPDFAVWIHTVRRKANLNDPIEYPDLLSKNIHEIWVDKNYWDNKFINTLYISIVYRAPTTKISSFDAFINTLMPKVVEDFYDEYFTSSVEILTEVVDGIVEHLGPLGVAKLQIRQEGEFCYSDPLFLLRRIINLNEENVLLPVTDCAKALATYNYAVGNDQIEVIDDKGKKFAGILSIKEYHEMSEEVLNKLLTLSVEFVATEIFYFIPKKNAIESSTYTDYILKTSKDEEARTARGIDKMMDMDDGATNFCNQQISLMIIEEDTEQLDIDIKKASKELSLMGMVHIREDINLEQTFWAQLPGNFSFIRRMEPTIIDNVAALASLHNFPTGSNTNPWGRAVTLMRTESGTPHFMNFHNAEGMGHSLIFGAQGSGRGVILNFLLSEAMKFRPTLVYVATSSTSDIFIDAIGGEWLDLNAGMKISVEPNKTQAFRLSETDDPERRYEIFKETMSYLANMPSPEPKIFAINNIALLFNDPRFDETIGEMLDALHKNNGILLATINLHRYQGSRDELRWKSVIDRLGFQMILTDGKHELDMQTLLDLTDSETAKLHSFTAISRLFLAKQDDRSFALELSLGGLPGILKMLSASEKELEIYRKIRAQEHENPEEWVIALYDALLKPDEA